MNIKTTEENGVTVVYLEGEMDTVAAAEVKPQFDELMGNPDRNFRIDCSGLSYIASAGLRQLLALRKATKAAGRTVEIVKVSELVMEVFVNTGFDQLFIIK